MVMTSELVSETVSMAPRPSFQQRSVYSNLEVSSKRRHKEQVTFRPVLAPVKYADTAYLFINNTRRRFVSKTFYEPRLKPRGFSETTYANPRTVEERYVSCLDHFTDESKKWFKTCLMLKAKNLKSTCHFVPNQGSLNSSADVNVRNGYDSNTNCGSVNHLVDENMNTRIQEPPEEKYDPGASQVFIPKRSPSTHFDDLSLTEGQILVNIPEGDVHVPWLNGNADDFL